MNSSTAAAPASRPASSRTGSRPPRIAADQPRSGPRSSFGNPEHVADQPDGQRRGEIFDEIERPGVLAAVEQRLASTSTRGWEGAQGARREGGGEPLADPRMAGRVVEHQAGRVVLVEGGVAHHRPEIDALVRREAPGVLVDRGDVGVAGEEDRPVAHPVDRVVAAQRAVGGVRVFEEAGGSARRRRTRRRGRARPASQPPGPETRPAVTLSTGCRRRIRSRRRGRGGRGPRPGPACWPGGSRRRPPGAPG